MLENEVLDKIAERDEVILSKITEMTKGNEALQTRIEEMERIAAPRRKAFTVDGLEKVKESFSFIKAINAISTGDWSNAGFEKEMFDETAHKAMSQGVDTAGGYVVPNQYIAELIELLRANTVVMESGATVLSGLTGSPVEIPKQTGGATAYWVGENAAITASDLTVGQIKMTPKAVAAMVKLSNRLIRMSNPSAEAMVRRDIVREIALAIDLAALRGTGSNNQPLGIANTASINTKALGTNGAVPDFDTLLDMEYELEVDNALRGSLGFIWHPAIRRALIKLKVAQYSGDTAGQYIVQPVSENQLTSWIGYPYRTSTQIPVTLTKGTASNCTEIYFGNWEEFIIGQWAGLEIMASQETSDAFEKNQTWVRIIQEVDMAVRHPESFCVCSDAKIA
jgi:HK97 family phage major capsid protein